MKALPWVLAAVGIGLAAYVVLNAPEPQVAGSNTPQDAVEDAARETGNWGTEQRVTGTGRKIAGKVKKGLGKVTGNDQLASEGVGDQIAGKVKNAAGSVAQAAWQTIHDLNK